ncbi:MAG TPA: HAMP domain-containing protein, partial [Thermoanaerobaculia bacterium]
MAITTSETPGGRFGLRAKFIIGIAVLTGIIAVLIVLIEQYTVRRAIIAQTTEQGISIADTIESTAGYYVIFGLTDDLKSITEELKKNATVEYADFLSAEGNVLAATDAAKLPAALKAARLTRDGSDLVAERSEGDIHLSIRAFFESRDDAANPAAKPRGYFRLALNEDHAEAAVRRIWLTNLLVILIAIGVGTLLANWGARILLRPIVSLANSAGEISRGDLTRRAEVTTADELGGLGESFNKMAGNLETTIAKVVQAQGKIAGVVDTVGSRSATVIGRADEQRVVLDEAYFSIDALNSGIRKISDSVETLSASSEETSSSILEMVASMEEVSRHTDSLFGSVEDTSTSTHEMVSSINEVDQNMDFLRNFVTDTSSAMMQMSASISQVESNAAKSYDIALGVADAAESGMKAVRETIEGMEQIRQSVHDSNAVVSRLGERSVEIGKILNVIEDVAEQTNLL